MIAHEFFGIWDSIGEGWVRGVQDRPYVSTNREKVDATCAKLIDVHRKKFKESLEVVVITDTSEIGERCSVEIASEMVNGISALQPRGIITGL